MVAETAKLYRRTVHGHVDSASNSLKRLAKIEAALELLLVREKAFVMWHWKVESESEALQAAIDAGVYNPDVHDLVLIRSNIEMKTRYDNDWTDDPPRANRGPTLAQEIAEMAHTPRFEGSYPTEPPQA